MKIRLSFVSNSSSVSFLIATKQELTEELLRTHLKINYKTSNKSSYFAKELWENIVIEEEPYEYDFYEVTIGKEPFNYYPGSIVSDQPRLWPLHGLKIEKDDFILCIGYFDKFANWHKKYIQKVNFRNSEIKMIGVKLRLSYENINIIDEITNLRDLKNLMILDLQGNNIVEIEGLNGLQNLRRLSLDFNKIKEIQGLEDLINLEILNLKGNKLEIISGLNQLSNLEELNLSENTKITEIEGLNHLVKLQTLDISNTKISEIKGLENLKSLRHLKIKDTKISPKLIEELGGINFWGGSVNNPKKFVDYCKKNKDL